jgi:hypothetical protein
VGGVQGNSVKIGVAGARGSGVEAAARNFGSEPQALIEFD